MSLGVNDRAEQVVVMMVILLHALGAIPGYVCDHTLPRQTYQIQCTSVVKGYEAGTYVANRLNVTSYLCSLMDTTQAHTSAPVPLRMLSSLVNGAFSIHLRRGGGQDPAQCNWPDGTRANGRTFRSYIHLLNHF